jgi:hypothetical protein
LYLSTKISCVERFWVSCNKSIFYRVSLCGSGTAVPGADRHLEGHALPSRMSLPAHDGLDLHCDISAEVWSHEESVFLVSREGTKFPVSEEVARQSSPYFLGLLESCMSEAGKFA